MMSKENGNNQLHSVNLKISGMSCAACAARIAGIIEAERYNTARYTVEIPE